MNTNLTTRKAVFYGDSICEAYRDTPSRFGWAGRAGETLGLAVSKNCGISGASLSTCRGANRVICQMEREGGEYDLVFLHGGVNDAWESAPIGEMSPASPEDTDLDALNQDTLAGALEYLIAKAKQTYPNAKIGYIINFRLVSGIGSLSSMDGYVAMTKKICAKWGIPTCDLYGNKELNDALDLSTPKHAADGIHPNGAGYDLIATYIIDFVAELAAE